MNATALGIKSPPPKPEVRKTIPINIEYDERAKALLKSVMVQRGISMEELARRLNGMGVSITAGGLANKISRGGFASSFFLQCMEAMEINLVALPR